MPTTSRPKTEDKFSQARAAKNSPERQAAAEKKRYKETPPKSVQAEFDAVAASKKKKAPVTMKKAAPSFKEHLAKNRVRDDERVHQVVRAILSAWKAEQGHAEHTAFSSGIIKVSRRQIEGALQDLKNTRFTKIPTFINDILTSADICAEFGTWVYVEHDSPDWIFVRLPENNTPVLRAQIKSAPVRTASPAITMTSEALLASYSEEAVVSNGPDVEALRKRLVTHNRIKPEVAARMSEKEVLDMTAFYAL